MAIKTGAVTVINNSYKLENVSDMTGNFTNFHPAVQTITTELDMTKNVMKLDMTGNVTFTTANIARGRQSTLVLDTSASGHTPTFPSEVKFNGSTPTWSSYRHWMISLTCWDGSSIRAVATGYVEPGIPTSSFSNFSFGPPNGPWNTVISHSASSGFVEAWAYISFKHNPGNQSVDIYYAGGDSGAPAVEYSTIAPYTGLTGITSVEVQYNVQSQVCQFDCFPSSQTWGPLPTNDGYNSGTYYTVNQTPGQTFFGWMAQANPNSGPIYNNQAQVSANFNSSNPDFRIKIVCNEGTFYSTGEVPNGSILLTANIGSQIVI